VREDGRLVGGKVWKERVYNREEWKKILKTARNRRILHMPKEQYTSEDDKVKCQLGATRCFIVEFLARHVSGTYAHHQER